MTNHASDFEGFYWYQWAVPLATWGALAGCVAGPLYAPGTWLLGVRTFMVGYLCLAAGHTWRLYCALGAVSSNVAMARKRAADLGAADGGAQGAAEAGVGRRRGEDSGDDCHPLLSNQTYYHMFVIPNYHEPLELLRRTLAHLAAHPAARTRYIVVPAMEAHEAGHERKAAALVEEFAGAFHLVLSTAHVKAKDEMGVAANTNWALRHAAAKLVASGYRLEEVIATKIDADAEVPQLYVEVLEQGLQAEENPHLLVFGSPTLYERNCYDVPHPTRVIDFNWSAMHWQQLCNSEGVGFPISNYSVSLKLLEDIDYLDTNALAIAEDAHLFLKAFFKTQGRARLHAIFVPFNMVCVKTDEGTWAKDVWARAVQAERHWQGVNEVAYLLKQSLRCGFLGWTHLLVTFRVIEANIFPGIIPTFFFVAGGAMGGIMWWTGEDSPELWDAVFATALMGNLLLLNQVLLYLIYDHIRQFCRKELYNLPQRAVRAAEVARDVVWMGVVVWLFVYIPHFIASTRAVLPCVEKKYVRGEKGGAATAAPQQG
eukprot:jgi/Tetstr1/466258/TSEL_010814.t1